MSAAEGAEYRMQPAVTLSEEYNDNIFLSPNNRVGDYITRAIPSLSFSYKAPFWDWDAAYAYDSRRYAKNNVDQNTHTLNLTNHTRIIQDFLFLDAADSYSRISLTPVRDFTQESLFVNQTDTNAVTVNPYCKFKASSLLTLTTGYQYRNIWYKNPGAIDKIDHRAYAEAKEELSQRTTITASARHTRTESTTLDYWRTDLSAGPRYEYADGSTVWFTIGNTWVGSDMRERESQAFWDTGITLKYLTYTLSFNTATTYIDDPLTVLRREDRYVATFNKQAARFTLDLSAGLWEYRDAVTKHLQNSRYGTAVTFNYSFTQALHGIYNLTINRLEDNQLDTYSSLYLNGVRFEYLLAENTTLSVDYRYADNYSPDPANYYMNYYDNRFIVEIAKKF